MNREHQHRFQARHTQCLPRKLRKQVYDDHQSPVATPLPTSIAVENNIAKRLIAVIAKETLWKATPALPHGSILEEITLV